MTRLNRVLTISERKARGAILFNNDPGLTEQSHAESCDINHIMASYIKSGQVPVMANQVPRYDDFSSVKDFHSALNLVIQGEEAFAQLPANVRKEYDHDPANFLIALEDPTQRAKLIELGVFQEVVAPIASPIIEPLVGAPIAAAKAAVV